MDLLVTFMLLAVVLALIFLHHCPDQIRSPLYQSSDPDRNSHEDDAHLTDPMLLQEDDDEVNDRT